VETFNLMKKKKIASLKEYTESKLRYSQLYLDELKSINTTGSDEEKAHQESFLFHLKSVVDAFLAELNELYDLGIKKKNLSIESIKAAKYDSKKSGKEGKRLKKLMGKKNWLGQLFDFDPNEIPETKKQKKTKGKEKPETSSPVEQVSQVSSNPSLDRYEEWQAKMRKLISELRISAMQSTGNTSKK
jgi:hypothetical protein